LATTLNPHYEGNDVGSMINEDKLILTSMDNWLFLEDTTGNIMSQSNMQSLFREVEKRCQEKKCKVGLVTADGSIDCQINPSEQEATVIELQFAEIVTALHILGKGGSFILKIFTFLECQTINHLYLLASLFTEVIRQFLLI
jgi:cap2 methyltransferase